MTKQAILVIVGPTAVGKTELSLELAQELSGEIVSADSMQVYRGMNIGTAKPTIAEQQLVPHHLIDIREPDPVFNAAEFVSLAELAIEDIASRRKVPIVSGGTGLYIDALVDGFLFPDSTADPILRRELRVRASKDPEALFRELEQVDPQSAERLHPNDLRRIVRALEVYYRTGEPISALQQKAAQTEKPYDPLFVGLTRNRPELYERINKRVDQMMTQGLVKEVKQLIEHYPHQPTALQALGYKEIVWYLKGTMSLEEAVEILKRDTRRYAKRQLSWFRRNSRIHWFNLSHGDLETVKAKVINLWKGTHN